MKVFICGANGRMGREIRDLIEKEGEHSFVGGFGRKADGMICESFGAVLETPDVVIDFSLPGAFDQALVWCLEKKIPFVSGTTGLSTTQFEQLGEASKSIPVLWSANMAPGVQIMKNLLKTMKLLPDFNVQMTESHHIHKKDKPSGTAIMLQEVLNKKREGLPGPLSIRGGGIFGVHKVEFMAPEEVITIEHQALSRTVFARGALQVAQWILSQKSAQYTMDDVLKSW